jgi:clan AA aspartic protease (TIGR02281 family)
MYRQFVSLALCCLAIACSDNGRQSNGAGIETLPSSAAQQPQPLAPQPAAAPATDNLVAEIPLEDDGGTFLVPVTINDAISLKFTIDSGAADVTIPSDVASTLVRAGTISSTDYVGSQTFVLADGSTIPSPEFRIRSLRVGNLVLRDVIASVTGPNGSLLLGQTFLTRLKHWSIDNDHHVLRLAARAVGPGASGGSPPTATIVQAAGESTDVSPEVEASARKAVADFFAVWSNPNDPDGSSMRRFYAASVNFYGKQMSLEQLMQEKLRFARRWPTRSYTVEPDTLRISCSSQSPVCTVAGVLDWNAAGPGEARTSTGTARFSLSYEGGRIVAEHGRVLSRSGAG